MHCCRMCHEYHEKSYKKKVAHGKKCEMRGWSDPQSVLAPAATPECASEHVPGAPHEPGTWLPLAYTDVQCGVDISTERKSVLKPGSFCREVDHPVLLCGEGDDDALSLRLPLEEGGWVTLAERSRSTGTIISSFHPPTRGWESLFDETRTLCFDGLCNTAREAYRTFEECQKLVIEEASALVNITSDGATSMQYLLSRRDAARAHALQCVADVVTSPLAARCQMDSWSGGGEREELAEVFRKRLARLEQGSAADPVQALKDLHMCRGRVDQATVAAMDAAHAINIAPHQRKSKEELAELTAVRDATRREQRLHRKAYDRKVVQVIGLMKNHCPELRPELIKSEADFVSLNIQDDPYLQEIFALGRDLQFYDRQELVPCDGARQGRNQVFEAEDADGRACILKKINWQSNKGLRCFVNEVSLLAKLKHPLVVPVQCAYADFNNQSGILQFDKFECNLDQWMQRQATNPDADVTDACRIVFTMLEAVVWIHSQDIVHGDIKLSNFLWDSRTSLPRLHDFETAREDCSETPGGHSTTTCPALTWEYAAPELRMDPQRRKDKQTDVYALGICIDKVLQQLARCRSSQLDGLRGLASKMKAYNPSERTTAVQAQEDCRQLLHQTCHVETDVVKCRARWRILHTGYLQ
ncbi:unnamed protein product [Prorocentrum cordatum]|uniref:Protein kinase domain-containing protein n=1 Tax=Prorocentrum cordatum TaxID=2364126 RepID=A0ABN9SGD4_9DINO|nr:unnamed protein product [Polarella glacialis]